MFGDFQRLFPTLFDFSILAFELLLVCESHYVLIEVVEFVFLFFLLIDDLVEVLFDVEEGVDVGDVVRTFFDVECLVMHPCLIQRGFFRHFRTFTYASAQT